MRRPALLLLALLLAGCVTQENGYDSSCVTNVTLAEVRGSSLAPIVVAGENVTVMHGWHFCDNLSRGDLVAYRFAGNDAPLLKIVKAVPGDRWRLDGCSIVVNDETLRTVAADGTGGEPYCIPDTRRLRLYVDDYPTIPENTYLLMGNVPSGSLDGSVFGLVDASDIVGKAVPNQ